MYKNRSRVLSVLIAIVMTAVLCSAASAAATLNAYTVMPEKYAS